MQAHNHLRYLLFIIFIFVSHFAFSQLSKTHYIPPLTSSSFGNANPEDQYIYISTPSNSPVPYTIIPVGQPANNYITGMVSHTSPIVQSIGTGNGQLFMSSTLTSVVTNNKGYIIEAEAPVYVSVRMNAGGGAQAGALVSKGLSALGTTFRVGSYTNENPQDNYLNFVSVMATENDTQITFDNLPTGLIIKNYNGTTPISVTLNEGESYIVATNSFDSVTNRDGLIGCLVTSDKPIVVNCGSANGSFGSGNGRDYGLDQIAGLSKVGSEYIFVKGHGDNSWENVLLVPHTYPTDVFINGNTTPITISAANRYALIEGTSYNSNGNMYISTSGKVFAYQGIGSSGEANQGMFFVPPLSCETRGNIDNIAFIDEIGSTTYSGGVSIVSKSGANITINNQPLSNFSTTGPSNVDGKPDYVTYQVTGLTNHVSVQGDDELYVAYFNANGAATTGSFYSGFPTKPEINFETEFNTLGNCIPNIKLEAANATNFDSYEWFYDDGTGYQLLAANVPKITPTIPGKYKLIGIITCTGETLESTEVPVSICPDDIDNDGIIDNLDIDNDNDGILNCLESRGDVVLDLSNTRPPRLAFQDGTINSNIATDNGTTSSMRLTATGNIFSDITASSNAVETYDISFTEPVNIKFSEDVSHVHTSVDGEYFIVKITPSNKNITLVDPDHRLLVDSNFDGLFESGVTQISGSEIHFKFNPTPLGNTPYNFLANQVSGFSFTHKLDNLSNSSNFQANLSLTCFKNDHDNDGIKDELDLDSDNDGIPDFIENQGVFSPLTGVDSNLDGLDDAYNMTLSPVDTDADGILDFYDLDSDNDGIYDLIESGQFNILLSDTNLDGIEDGPNFGVNGWADAAETTPDSNLIGYILPDTNSDLIFNYINLDSDGDLCSDVLEAGFSDGNSDHLLGDTTITVDQNGIVNNANDGYTIPNNDYVTIAPLTVQTQPIDMIICELVTETVSVTSIEAETYQWEVSNDGVNWLPVIDNLNYNGAQTASLNILSAPITLNNNLYRVFLNRTGNSCGLYSNEIKLTVNPNPVVSSPVILIQCDDDDPKSLGYSPFNLTEANDEISSNAINETFTYFKTESAAISGDVTNTDYINSPTDYTNTTVNSDTVWARIESQQGCTSTARIDLKVSTTTIPSSFLMTYNQCDDFLDMDGHDNANNDNKDGIATFDFSNAKTVIENLFLPQTPTISFYRNEVDALAEINKIINITDYRNIGYPHSQFIYVRVDSQLSNDCLGLGPHILLDVETLPIANPVNIPRQCDSDTSDAILSYPFDTSQIETELLNGQNPADVVITYFDENGLGLPSPLPNPFTSENQVVTVRVTNSSTLAPDGPCYNETTLNFIVDEQPIIAQTIAPQIACDGTASDIEDDGFYPFNTSNFTSTIIGSQSNMTVLYDYVDENNIAIIESSTLPNPLVSGNQTIIVKVINPINTSCYASTFIDLIVNPLPDFTVESPRLVCSSDPTFSILLNTKNTNTTEVFDYEWLWTSLDGSVSNQFISNATEITVSSPGTYTVKLTKTDGTGCARSEDILVEASELPNISQDDVTIEELQQNNTVTIDPTNLGMGAYEYALSEVGSTSIDYQYDPVFHNVTPGFYTIYVMDVICGTVTLDISVIGYDRFFTPNGDGINDTWKIGGLGDQVQPNTAIYIYNRYGKLLKQLAVQSDGWDGTYKGEKLPTDDYWFKVFLEDGREFSGHFTLKR
ncbi:T9SS type B sorting domain-containing protein [Tamlana agarivorans]|uniref:T9SS type B sorting domain-containing protein n=1 Tax=Pseudotamlana agarivorans TaxID=481183 RepID=A0ACC5UBA1_9FLAO|nr:T9SS type B sorting domain-containing protein [Tamlana agarivorans]MBU2951606.1 T9SS type B sorting domain-containing protein [Tamlana agarivorans]